jgi:hypothetical protein
MHLIHRTLFLGLLCLSVLPANGASVLEGREVVKGISPTLTDDGSSTECGSESSAYSEKGMSPKGASARHTELIKSLATVPPGEFMVTVKEIVDILNSIAYPHASPINPKNSKGWQTLWQSETSFWYETYKAARQAFDKLDLRTPERQAAIEGIAHDLIPWMHKWPSQRSWKEALGAYIFFPKMLYSHHNAGLYVDYDVPTQYAVATAAHYGNPEALDFLSSMLRSFLPESYDMEDAPATIEILNPVMGKSFTYEEESLVSKVRDITRAALVLPATETNPLFIAESVSYLVVKSILMPIYRGLLIELSADPTKTKDIDPRLLVDYMWHRGDPTVFPRVFEAAEKPGTPYMAYKSFIECIEAAAETSKALYKKSMTSFETRKSISKPLKDEYDRTIRELLGVKIGQLLDLSSITL